MTFSCNGRSGYETFDHTADVGLAVRGTDLPDLFVQAVIGLAATMFGAASVAPRQARPVRVEGEGDEALLVAWLEEVLFAFEVDGFLTAAVRLDALADGAATGALLGELYDPDRHELGAHVKAVTWHDLAIRRLANHYEVRVVFDV